MRVENLKTQESVVESVLFTMGQSVEIRQLAAALESDEETAIQAVERLKEKYDKRKAGMQIVRLDDSYQMWNTISSMRRAAWMRRAARHFLRRPRNSCAVSASDPRNSSRR